MKPTPQETRILFEHFCNAEMSEGESFSLSDALEWTGLDADRADDVRAALQLAIDDDTMSFDGVRYRWED